MQSSSAAAEHGVQIGTAVWAVPFSRPDGLPEQAAFAMNEEGDAQSGHPIHYAHRAVHVQHGPEADAELFEERAHLACRLLEVHAEDREAALTIGAMQTLHDRHLVAAGNAPRRPEVQKDDRATETLERPGCAVGIGETEPRRRNRRRESLDHQRVEMLASGVD